MPGTEICEMFWGFGLVAEFAHKCAQQFYSFIVSGKPGIGADVSNNHYNGSKTLSQP